MLKHFEADYTHSRCPPSDPFTRYIQKTGTNCTISFKIGFIKFPLFVHLVFHFPGHIANIAFKIRWFNLFIDATL